MIWKVIWSCQNCLMTKTWLPGGGHAAEIDLIANELFNDGLVTDRFISEPFPTRLARLSKI